VSCVVPVALIFVKLPVPEFNVAMLPVVAKRVVKYEVTNEAMFPRIFATVVDPSVVEPAVRFVA
jgi:hypothetical protein